MGMVSCPPRGARLPMPPHEGPFELSTYFARAPPNPAPSESAIPGPPLQRMAWSTDSWPASSPALGLEVPLLDPLPSASPSSPPPLPSGPQADTGAPAPPTRAVAWGVVPGRSTGSVLPRPPASPPKLCGAVQPRASLLSLCRSAFWSARRPSGEMDRAATRSCMASERPPRPYSTASLPRSDLSRLYSSTSLTLMVSCLFWRWSAVLCIFSHSRSICVF
mmetsp:Transcript_56756/g.179424  ORF Transcript_56756/g.179424 Transcript_56756/m.179424 type:complete len:220 (+) Transcript_56756:952-1611(+)